ncbi:MAG TPA: hypothetical protein VNB49_14880, partial [Candidatus Dormibacteraeota bacterium]|nr:hypothetical protein [Candidatus Dormibacteraeota bacterium]
CRPETCWLNPRPPACLLAGPAGEVHQEIEQFRNANDYRGFGEAELPRDFRKPVARTASHHTRKTSSLAMDE